MLRVWIPSLPCSSQFLGISYCILDAHSHTLHHPRFTPALHCPEENKTKHWQTQMQQENSHVQFHCWCPQCDPASACWTPPGDRQTGACQHRHTSPTAQNNRDQPLRQPSSHHSTQQWHSILYSTLPHTLSIFKSPALFVQPCLRFPAHALQVYFLILF